jgi:hypothetical protein
VTPRPSDAELAARQAALQAEARELLAANRDSRIRGRRRTLNAPALR